MGRKKSLRSRLKKIEFSKVLCGFAFVALLILGVWMVVRYYNLAQVAIESGSVNMPDAALPIAGVSMIIAPIASYVLYQFGMKNSRNKYGVDADGVPYKQKVEYESVEESEQQ